MEKNGEKNSEVMKKNFSRTDHLANERTFLAWIRTNLGIMAFGFVIEKFSFFIDEISSVLSHTKLNATSASTTLTGYSSIFGITLIGVGAIFCIFAFLKFKKTERQIIDETYRPANFLNITLTVLVLLIGIFLITYLIKSNQILMG